MAVPTINAILNFSTGPAFAQTLILDNNQALATKYLAELSAAEAIKKLAEDAAKAGGLLVDGATAAFARLALYNPVNAYGATNSAAIAAASSVSTNATSFVGTPFGQAGGNNGAINSTPVEITLELAPNAGEFGQLIYNSFLINQKNGYNQTPAGSL